MAQITSKSLDGMTYEVAGSKKINGKQASIKVASQLSTALLLWLLAKRHKVVLLAIGNVILVLNYVFPEWLQLLQSII